MTPQERAAFVEAYATSVADVPEDRVAEFINQYCDGVILHYSGDYTSIMDALGIWHSAVKWQMKQGVLA
jgi:hypothetical protein